jgi:hypothetical protein
MHGRNLLAALLISIALAAVPVVAHAYNVIYQRATSGCSPTAPEERSDTYINGVFSPMTNSQTCLLGFPPASITETATADITVTRNGSYGTPNQPLPWKADLLASTDHDSSAWATLTENVLLRFSPPAGNPDANVVGFSLVDHATFTLSTGQFPNTGASVGYLQIASPTYPGLYVRDSHNVPGSFIEDVATPSVLVNCCHLSIQLTTFVSAAGFASSSLSDPLTVVLDPAYAAAGWTWTFDDAPAPIPEPATWLMLVAGAVPAILLGWRRASTVAARAAG